MGAALEVDDQTRGQGGQDHDPVRIGEPVTTQRELARHMAVPGEDRQQAWERIEAGVRGEEQEQRREGLEEVERNSVAKHLLGDLRDHGDLDRMLDRGDPEVHREERDPDEQDAEQAGHDGQGGRRVLRLGRLECRDARGDRLGAGQRHGAGRKRSQDEDRGQRFDRALDLLLELGTVARALPQHDDPEHADRDHE